MIELLANGLIVWYGDIMRENGPVLNYLGMVFDLTIAGTANVTMGKFVEDLLEERSDTRGTVITPATNGLTCTDSDAGLVNETNFHRCVAKMLYLARRVRPD